MLGEARVDELLVAAARLREVLGESRIVNVNSTATGGGVAEMLADAARLHARRGLETDWLVIDGDPEFFAVTKRIHNGLYGGPGDGGGLGAEERAHYDAG